MKYTITNLQDSTTQVVEGILEVSEDGTITIYQARGSFGREIVFIAVKGSVTVSQE